MRDWLLAHATVTYIGLAMVLSYIVQFFVNRKRMMKLTEKFLHSFICALMTAAISVPLLDLYPELPPSIVLLVGSFCGSIGVGGITGIMRSAERAISGQLGGYTPPADFQGFPQGGVPHRRKTHYYRPPPAEDTEPPMPDDIRDYKNE